MNTEFNPNAGERIDKTLFDAMRADFLKQFPGATEANYLGRHCFDALLAMNPAGIRIYHGLNAEGQIKHMLVGYDFQNMPLMDGAGIVIYEVGQPCPPFCNQL